MYKIEWINGSCARHGQAQILVLRRSSAPRLPFAAWQLLFAYVSLQLLPCAYNCLCNLTTTIREH